MRSLARESICPHSDSNAALYKGVTVLMDTSTGIEEPEKTVARSVTFGSRPLNAERRNLNTPEVTSSSVQARSADFCSFRASRRSAWGMGRAIRC